MCQALKVKKILQYRNQLPVDEGHNIEIVEQRSDVKWKPIVIKCRNGYLISIVESRGVSAARIQNYKSSNFSLLRNLTFFIYFYIFTI